MLKIEDRPHASEFVEDELVARGWSWDRLKAEIGGDPIDGVALDMWRSVGHPARLGEQGYEALSRVFGTSVDYWRRLDTPPRESGNGG